MITSEEIEILVSNSMGKLEDLHLKSKLEVALVDPTEKVIEHFGSSREASSCHVWIVFDVRERDVVLLYSCGGYSSEGYPWGIAFRDAIDSGPPSCWYKSLVECAKDSGYFD